MRSTQVLLVCAVLLAVPLLSVAILSSSNDAYPSGYGDGLENCVGAGPVRREVYGNGEIYDITHRVTPRTPVGDSSEGIGQFLKLLLSIKNGSDYNFSEMKIPVHSGTHVDAPGHFYDNYFGQGFDVDSLDLRVLNGPALLVDVPRDNNITVMRYIVAATADYNLLSEFGGIKETFGGLQTSKGLLLENALRANENVAGKITE